MFTFSRINKDWLDFYTIIDDNLWLTQKSLAELFKTGVNNINYHINDIYSSNELNKDSTFRNFRIVQKEGIREVERDLKFYSLEMVIAVGFRVNSKKATVFRNWAINILKITRLKEMF